MSVYTRTYTRTSPPVFIVQDNAETFVQIVQIGPLYNIATIQTNRSKSR